MDVLETIRTPILHRTTTIDRKIATPVSPVTASIWVPVLAHVTQRQVNAPARRVWLGDSVIAVTTPSLKWPARVVRVRTDFLPALSLNDKCGIFSLHWWSTNWVTLCFLSLPFSCVWGLPKSLWRWNLVAQDQFWTPSCHELSQGIYWWVILGLLLRQIDSEYLNVHIQAKQWKLGK